MANRNRKRLLILALVMLVVLTVLIAVAFIVGRTPSPNISQLPTAPSSEATEPSIEPPTEPATEPPPTEPPVVKESTFTLSATGDMLMHMPVIRYYKSGSSYNFNGAFTYLKEYAQKADYAVANLETTLSSTNNGYKYSGYPQFNCPDAIVDGLKNAGFDMLLTANNHSYDTRSTGIKRTQTVIADRGLAHLGTQPDAEACDYLLVEQNGITLGMMCYTYETDSSPNTKAPNGITMSKADAPLICTFDYSNLSLFYGEVEEYIAEMKELGAEAIVMFIHWGVEYQTTHNSTQSAIAQKLCDLGVDVIIGGHPHVVQPVALLTSKVDPDHKTVCLYSMGNALSNQRRKRMNLKTGHTEDGILFSVTFAKYSDGTVILEDADALPLWVTDKYCILPLDKSIENWQTKFGVNSSTLSLLNSSYDRTMKIVGKGMEQVQTYLEDHVAQVEAQLNVQK